MGRLFDRAIYDSRIFDTGISEGSCVFDPAIFDHGIFAVCLPSGGIPQPWPKPEKPRPPPDLRRENDEAFCIAALW
jgi:hypothetical protein